MHRNDIWKAIQLKNRSDLTFNMNSGLKPYPPAVTALLVSRIIQLYSIFVYPRFLRCAVVQAPTSTGNADRIKRMANTVFVFTILALCRCPGGNGNAKG